MIQPAERRRVANPGIRGLAILLACLLVAVGFLIDGSTEVGHHAALILGGIIAGLGLRG